MYINICMDTDQSNELIAKACQKRLSLATGEIIGQHQLSHDCHRAAMQIDDLVIATQTDLSLFGFLLAFACVPRLSPPTRTRAGQGQLLRHLSITPRMP
jgi:hypothetical protein